MLASAMALFASQVTLPRVTDMAPPLVSIAIASVTGCAGLSREVPTSGADAGSEVSSSAASSSTASSASASSTAVAVATGSPARTPSSLDPDDATRATHPPRPSRPISRRTPQPTTNQIQVRFFRGGSGWPPGPPTGRNCPSPYDPAALAEAGYGDPWTGYEELAQHCEPPAGDAPKRGCP